MSTYFLLSEVTNGYGLLLIGLMFVGALGLYRNNLLGVFSPTLKTLLNRISSIGGYLNPFYQLKKLLLATFELIRK